VATVYENWDRLTQVGTAIPFLTQQLLSKETVAWLSSWVAVMVEKPVYQALLVAALVFTIRGVGWLDQRHSKPKAYISLPDSTLVDIQGLLSHSIPAVAMVWAPVIGLVPLLQAIAKFGAEAIHWLYRYRMSEAEAREEEEEDETQELAPRKKTKTAARDNDAVVCSCLSRCY
jgi:hypothetical protein